MKTILVVDDNHDIRELAVTMLSELGYNCLQAEDGERGVEVLKSNHVDLIFTDVIMPGRIRSVDMVQTAKEELCMHEIKVLYTSGYPTIDRSIVGEFAQVLPKPYSMDALGRRMQEMLGTEPVQS